MLPFEIVFSALFGLAFGSFLNVCIVRLPRDESIVRPRSRCFQCGAELRAQDNIPLFSWIFLRGRSHCCGAPIPLRYPMVEAATAILFVVCLLRFGVSLSGAGMAVFCWLLLGLACMDADTYLLPDAFTLPGLALGLLYQGLAGKPWGTAVLQSLLAAAATGGALLAVALLYRLARRRQGMGLGDVKLGAMLGAWLGWQLAGVALFLAVVSGALAGIAWALLRRESPGRSFIQSNAARSSPAHRQAQAAGSPLRLPFGSFLAAAGVTTVFGGRWLLAWYLQFFR